MKLFHKKRRFGKYEMYNFIAAVEDNPNTVAVARPHA